MPVKKTCRYACSIAAALLTMAACLPSLSAQAAEHLVQQYPDVVSVSVKHVAGDIFDFDVTVSSPYDTPQRYADAFHVMDKNGNVFGERILVHDHESEQPFTRDLYGVKIPKGIRLVDVQGRDQKFGYGGKMVEVLLPGR